MTTFRAIRNFLRKPGEDVVAGTLLELDDAEAALLVALGAVTPFHERDRARLVVVSRIEWAPAREADTKGGFVQRR